MDIVDRLKIKSNMIFLGERIAFGSECALMDEAADEITSLRNQLAECQWISVKDKMPDMCVDVLCYCVNNRGEEYQKILGINADGEWQSEHDYYPEDAFIDYWMPLDSLPVLPAAPTDEE